MNSPRVDIVIPVYNEGAYIAECLESVLRQTYQNWRAVVVNNCSTDNTGAIADQYAARDPRLTVIHATEFVDQCGNYNRAMAQATPEAKYVKLLESDNWLTPDSIERCVALAEQDPEIGIVATYWFRGARVEGSALGPANSIVPGRVPIDLLYERRLYLFGTPSTLLFTSRALRAEKEVFKPGIFFDDVELCMRILAKWKLGFVHQVLAYVRDDNGGYFSKVRKMDHEPAYRYFLLKENGDKFYQGEALQKHERKARREYFGRLGFSIWIARRDAKYRGFHQALFQRHGMTFSRTSTILPALWYLSRPLQRGWIKFWRLITKQPALPSFLMVAMALGESLCQLYETGFALP